MFKIQNLLFICIFFLFNLQFIFCQEKDFEVLNNNSLEIVFNDTLTEVRFKSLLHNKFLNGKKKIIYENKSFSELNFIDGYPDGKWVMIDSLRNKIFVTDYLKGRKHGKEIYYYPNGINKLKTNFVNGYQEGKTLMYYPSGIIGGEFFCKKGKKHGIEKWFHHDTRKIIYKAFFLNNKKVDSLTFYKNGNGLDGR